MLVAKNSKMVLYDANDDEVHHINYGKLDSIDDNLFTIQHPEPYVRPNIALNLTTNQIAELRGVCFTDSFSIPHKNENNARCCVSKIHIFDRSCVFKIIMTVVLIVGWTLFVVGIIKQTNVKEREGWMFFTLIFIILLLATISLRKMLSRCQNKSEPTSNHSSCKGIKSCLPCFKSVKDEEESILYSLKT